MLNIKDSVIELKKNFQKRTTILDMLILLFGFGSRFVAAAVEYQLPLIVKSAPEGLALPAYLNVSAKLANVSILLYIVMKRILKDKLNDRYYIYSIMFLDIVAALLLAFFYSQTIKINGVEFSGALLILDFFAVLYGGTSNVVCYPYLKNFEGIYITTFFVGRQLASLVISGVGAIQGIGEKQCGNTTNLEDEVLFGTKEVMLFVFAVMLTCFVAFYLLNNLKICKELRVETIQETENGSFSCMLDGGTILWLIVVVALGAQIYGFHLSIISYSTVPYGYKAYHQSIILKDIITTLVCVIPYFMSDISNAFILTNFSIGSATTLYLTMIAMQSPSPIFLGTDTGFHLVVFAWVLTNATLELSKISLLTKFRDPKFMTWCGAFIQIGSILGSIIGFVLINYSGLFNDTAGCNISNTHTNVTEYN